MGGAITLLPNTSSWHGAKLSNRYIFKAWYLIKHRGNFAFLKKDL
jgi:hypothetical protein